MKIRFSEHVPESHRDLILAEIALMGASAEQLDDDSYLITPLKVKRYSFVIDFLRQEQDVGNLKLETVEQGKKNNFFQ